MSAPSGWYDDGSGRQRWWDGTQWTEHYAAVGGAAAPQQAMPFAQPAPAAQPEPARSVSVLGIVGLGLAVLGTILVLIPVIVVFVVGSVLLLAALIVSIIALFRKGTQKWPGIAGIVLAVIGGIAGAVVFTITLFVTFVGSAIEHLPTDPPPSSLGSEPSGEPTDPTTASRPSPEEIADGYVEGLAGEAGLEEFTTPEAAECIGEYFYDSDVSDELLQKVAAGEVITEESAGDELELLESTLQDAANECVSF